MGTADFSPTTASVRTAPDVPEEVVRRPECVHAYPRAMTVQWTEPHSWGIPIKTFEIQYRGGGYRSFDDSPSCSVTRVEAFAESEKVKQRMKADAAFKCKAYQERKEKQLAQAERKQRMQMQPGKLKMYLFQLSQKFKQRTSKQIKNKAREIDAMYDGVMSATVKGLVPGNTYQYKICATNNIGSGPYSPVSISTATVSLPPQAMAQVYTSHITPFGCRVSWQKPDARGMPVVEYCIFFAKIDQTKEGKDKYRQYVTQLQLEALEQKAQNRHKTPQQIEEEQDDSMLDASKIVPIHLNDLRSIAIDKMPTIPSSPVVVALADMDDDKYITISGMEPGCNYVFAAACRNRHGFSTLSPTSELITTKAIAPNPPNTPGISHASSTALTLHFEMPHHNGAPITTILLIVREGDRENGKCGGKYGHEREREREFICCCCC